jgi:hypothetical protein
MYFKKNLRKISLMDNFQVLIPIGLFHLKLEVIWQKFQKNHRRSPMTWMNRGSIWSPKV